MPGRKAPKAPKSSIDLHPDRARIEYDLGRGLPLMLVAKRYGVSKSAAHRHLQKMPEAERKALLGDWLAPGEDLDRLKIQEGHNVIAHLAIQRARLVLEQDKAREDGHGSLVRSIADAIVRNLELTAKLCGKIGDGSSTVTNNVLVLSTAHYQFRDRILGALRGFPDAYQAVMAEFRAAEAVETAAAAPMIEARAA